MNEIQTTKIDGQEFVTLTDYLRLKEEKQEIENFIEFSKTEGAKVVKNGKWYVKVYGDIPTDPMVKLEDFQMIVREREQLKKEKQELEYLGDINEELKEENKKLKEEVKDLVERNIELNKKYMIVLTENRKLEADRDERKRKEECSNVIIDRVKEKGREKGWEL